MSEKNKVGFTVADIKVLRYLAVALGLITAIECVLAKSTEMLVLVIALNVVTMIACPLTICLLRSWRAK